MSVNKVILVGNLGRDPEIRHSNNNLPICTFTLATNEKRKEPNGSYVDQTEWHNIVVFGVIAENCAKFLKKGKQIYLEGKITTRKWQDKEGKDRYTTEIIATSVQFLGLKSEAPYSSDSNQGQSKNYGGGQGYGSQSQQNKSNDDFLSNFQNIKPADELGSDDDGSLNDDDIPF